MTNSNTAITAIRRFIYDATRRTYGSTAGRSVGPHLEVLKTPVLSSGPAGFRMELPSTFTEQIHSIRQRLPQTRFVFTQFTSTSLTVDWLDFFDRSLVVLQNHGTQPIHLNVAVSEKAPFKIFPVQNLASGRITLASELVLWNFNGEIHELPALLQGIRDDEYNNHPIKAVSCASPPLMKALDTAWAGLPYLDERFQIKTNIRPHELLWFQEILLFLGRYETLDKFYQKIKSHAQDTLFTLANNRFKQLVSGKKISPTPDFKAAQYDFLNSYLFPDDSKEKELTEQLQAQWEGWSWPLLQLKLQRDIQLNPHKWLAIYFLAQQRNYIWTDQLRKIIKEALAGQNALLHIFSILDLCRQIVRLQLHEDHLSFSAGQNVAEIQQLKHAASGFTFKQVHTKNEVICYLQNEKLFDFKSDRLLTLKYHTGDRLLQLIPVTAKPPLPELPYREILVEVGEYRLKIPLLWRQFYIVFNGTRIRFLRKNKRFQLSIKRPAELPALTIDNTPIPKDKGRYFKTYIDIEQQNSRFNIQLCDSSGRRCNNRIPYDGRVRISGTALDGFGLLKENFRLRRNDKPGSISVAANRPQGQLVTLSAKDESLILSARRCTPHRITLRHGIPLLQRLWVTAPGRLSLTLTVFVEEEAGPIRQQFFEAWGFYPQVQLMNRDTLVFAHGDIIITPEQPFVLIAGTLFGGIVRQKRKSAAMLLWVRPQQLPEFLNSGFCETSASA